MIKIDCLSSTDSDILSESTISHNTELVVTLSHPLYDYTILRI